MLWQPLRIANHVGKEKLDSTATDNLQIKIKRMFKSFYWIGFCMFVVWKGHTTTALHIISLIFCLPYNICQLFKECFWTWTNREKERRCDPVSCIVLPNNNLDSLSLPLLSYLPYLQLSHTDGPKTVKCSLTLQSQLGQRRRSPVKRNNEHVLFVLAQIVFFLPQKCHLCKKCLSKLDDVMLLIKISVRQSWEWVN